MLRPSHLARFLRRRSPGARERLVYRLLLAIAAEPGVRPVPVESGPSSRRYPTR